MKFWLYTVTVQLQLQMCKGQYHSIRPKIICKLTDCFIGKSWKLEVGSWIAYLRIITPFVKDQRMRPAAEKLLQHRFVIRPHPSAKMEFLPLIAATKEYMAATMARVTTNNLQGTLRNTQQYNELFPQGNRTLGFDSLLHHTTQMIVSPQL